MNRYGRPQKNGLHTYKGYKLTVVESRESPVSVYDPRYPRDPAVYNCKTVKEAEQWVDSYRRGAVWAEQSKEPVQS
jgi:hypothetical protein